MTGKLVVVRCRDAGVHVGILDEMPTGRTVTLTSARRLWSWTGANTLHEVALRGVGAGSKLSEPVQRVMLLEACEVILASEQAKVSLCTSVW